MRRCSEEHAEGVESWEHTYWEKGLDKGRGVSERAWAEKHFPDLSDLKRQYREEGGPDYAP